MMRQETEKIITRAPGRVCLFGEHQDYLDLPVIAAAIDRYVEFSAVENNARTFRFTMPDISEDRVIDIGDSFEKLLPRDYLGSVLKIAGDYGCQPDRGLDIEISGNIPINAGASSSTALTVAWANLLLRSFGADQEITPGFLAKAAHRAEVVEHQEPGGMMDHLTICHGNVLLIDAQNGYSITVLSKNLEGLILADSGIPKKTLNILSDVKQNVLAAIKMLEKQLPGFRLANITPDELPSCLKILPEKLAPYFVAAVLNHDYTKKALRIFNQPQPDSAWFGELMNRHHNVLKNHLKITVPKIDQMVKTALAAGAFGAKINGSGGGGTIVILAPGNERQVIEALREIDATAYSVCVDSGAKVVYHPQTLTTNKAS